MNITKEFKNVIKDTFYDKTVSIYSPIEEIGEELDVVKTKGQLNENIKCNVHFIGNEVVKRDYGLDVEANIMISCDTTNSQNGDFVSYLDKDYIITGILPFDSHIKIFAKLI